MRSVCFWSLMACLFVWAASYFGPGTHRPLGDLGRVQLLDGALVVLTEPLGGSARIAYSGQGQFLHTIWWTNWQFTAATMSIGAFSTRVLAFPLWIPTVVVLVAWRLTPRPVYVERACANCGYDLRATPDRCPECGKPA